MRPLLPLVLALFLTVPIAASQPMHVEGDSDVVDDVVYGDCPTSYIERCASWYVDGHDLGFGATGFRYRHAASDGDTLFVATSYWQGPVTVASLASNGTPGWSTAYDDSQGNISYVNAFVTDGDGLYLLARSVRNSVYGGLVTRFDAATGAVEWETFLTGPTYLNPVGLAVGADTLAVVVHSGGYSMIGVDAADGSVDWTTKFVRAPTFKVHPFWDEARDQFVFATTARSSSGAQMVIEAVDADGMHVWATAHPMDGFYVDAAAVDTLRGALGLIMYRDHVAQVDLTDGSLEWQEDTTQGQFQYRRSIMAHGDGWLVSATSGGGVRLQALDDDGDTAWDHTLANASNGQVVALDNGDIAVGHLLWDASTYSPAVSVVDQNGLVWQFIETSGRNTQLSVDAAFTGGFLTSAFLPDPETEDQLYHAFAFDNTGPTEHYTSEVHCMAKTNGQTKVKCDGHVGEEEFHQKLV